MDNLYEFSLVVSIGSTRLRGFDDAGISVIVVLAGVKFQHCHTGTKGREEKVQAITQE